MNSTKTSICIPNELYAKMKESAKKKTITVATLVKIACSEYIAGEEDKNKNTKKKD